MGRERFQSNPYPGLALSNDDHVLLLDLVNTLVQKNFEKYQSFVFHDQRRVDPTRWKHVKSRGDIHIHVRRDEPEEQQRGPNGRDIPVMLSVGTFPGKMDDLMLGVMNPTLDTMRMKASYVHDVNDAAILAPIVVPTEEDPFLSIVVKWMQRDLPLESTSLIKNRDFVYVEATGILRFANGERVGYHLMHSIDFSQTRPLPNVVRANVSICCMYHQLSEGVIDNHSFCTFEPGGGLPRFLMLPIAAECLLISTKFEPCGQMTKLAWRKHQRQSERPQARSSVCATCTKRFFKGKFGRYTCKICFNSICRSCRVCNRIAFIAPDGKMLQPKLTFCALCVSDAAQLDALDVARELAKGYELSKAYASSMETSSTPDTHSDHER